MGETPGREAHEGPYDGETRRLEHPAGGGRSCARFPWQALWLIWPLTFLLKGAGEIASPLLALASHCAICSTWVLPALLIGAGLILLLVGARAQRAG